MNEKHLIHIIVALMCITSGSIDALAITSLGDAFVTVITGNVVFLGVALGSRSAGHALACLIAVLGYILGTAAGTRLLVPPNGFIANRRWHRRVMIGISVELALFLVVAIAWLSAGAAPRSDIEDMILAVAAVAMGLQGVTARQFPMTVSTTYLTGALTGLVEALTARRKLTATESTAAWGLVSLTAGAAIAIAVLDVDRRFAIVVPLVALGLTLGVVGQMRSPSPAPTGEEIAAT